MKKVFLSILLFVAYTGVFAAGNDLQYEIRKADDSGFNTKIIASPATNGLFYYDPVAHLPAYATLGSGLTLSSGVISASGTAQVNSDWSAISGVAQILNKPTLGSAAALNVPSSGNAISTQIVLGSDTRLSDSRTPTTHTHLSTDISDLTALGRSLVTAASQSAARTAIGAGTSNFNGVYSSLTGLPTLFDGTYTSLTGKPTLFSGAYVDLSGKPTLFSGSYTDLTNKPTISTAGASGSYTDLINKPTISTAGATGSYADLINKPAIGKAIVGLTANTGTFPLVTSSTVSSGVAVFYLTADGTSTGTALFTQVYLNSVQLAVNDATASYQMGWAFTNSNKTLTVTVNKLGTANILTGVLGQTTAPNGTVVTLRVEGN